MHSILRQQEAQFVAVGGCGCQRVRSICYTNLFSLSSHIELTCATLLHIICTAKITQQLSRLLLDTMSLSYSLPLSGSIRWLRDVISALHLVLSRSVLVAIIRALFLPPWH